MEADPRRILLFRRDFQGLTGGHLKVWHYFHHAEKSRRFVPRIHFTAGSSLGEGNPWCAGATPLQADWRPEEASALFVAGLDWEAVPDPCPVPVINLIQHVRHAEADDPRRPFLSRAAIRICVSEEVAEAIEATGVVNGPIHVIPNGIDLGNIPCRVDRDVPVLIAGAKKPQVAERLAARLSEEGIASQVLVGMVPRPEFLDRLSRSEVVVTLPNDNEGFFLPALEAMAAGATVVCPDCVGNRGFCHDGETCFRPVPEFDAVVQATLAAVRLDQDARRSMNRRAAEQARLHGLEGEQTAFLRILDAV